ncbi:PEP-CTERM sorting domain-containing protein [Pseudaquabacterium rugosum]|uniref:PEP-CTERM sorting domain-containing protein n=1 Tax=Pseudaquabacterium rugosum TaxID=2984194 RepID=A0ABU9BGD5_9BURK
MNRLRQLSGIAAATAIALASSAAQASLITNGFTFAVASGSDVSAGSHFHSNTGGAFGNPSGKAEVGRFASEEVRGLSEYNIAGQSSASSAFVTFSIFKEGGLFPGVNSIPFTGTIFVEAYAGNNIEDISDYQATTLGAIGSFVASPLSLSPGDVISFDITSVFNAAIAANDTSLGMRLRVNPANADYAQSFAWTFDNFRLTTDNQSTVPTGNTVPEPTTLALVAVALAAAARSKRP